MWPYQMKWVECQEYCFNISNYPMQFLWHPIFALSCVTKNNFVTKCHNYWLWVFRFWKLCLLFTKKKKRFKKMSPLSFWTGLTCDSCHLIKSQTYLFIFFKQWVAVYLFWDPFFLMSWISGYQDTMLKCLNLHDFLFSSKRSQSQLSIQKSIFDITLTTRYKATFILFLSIPS